MKVRNDEPNAFEQLIKRWTSWVRSIFSRRLNSDVQVEDLTQEVFLRVYRARKSYLPSAKFCSWLATIAHNLLSSLKLKELRRKSAFGSITTHAAFVDAIETSESTPEEQLELNERRQLVKNAISQLHDRQHRAIRLFCFEHRCYAEIADELDLSIAATKSLLHRARQSLRQILADSREDLLV